MRWAGLFGISLQNSDFSRGNIDTVSEKSMKVFDVGIVPVQRAIEQFISFPWGKSRLFVLRFALEFLLKVIVFLKGFCVVVRTR